ncbi:MAG: hypothetical protein CMO55_13200 [Verrucomicrobiales bacterium]|nr:hypothetical protein [Verrucomicrobiales bacterium]
MGWLLSAEEKHQLIESYEDQMRTNPFGFRWKVFGLVALGYAFVWGVLFLNILFLAGLVWVVVQHGFHWWLIPAFGLALSFVIATVRSLLVRLPQPGGLLIDEQEFPFLHQKVKELRKPLKLRKKEVHLLIDWEFNAYAASRPKFGLFGPERFYVCLGLPLIGTLNEEQLTAVLAHELAHLSRKQRRMSSRLFRIDGTWSELLVRLEKHRISGFPFRAFTKWYVQYLGAAGLVAFRAAELEADDLAAAAVGDRAMAEANLRVATRGALVVAPYWEFVWSKAPTVELPAVKSVSGLIQRLKEPISLEDAVIELRWSLGERTRATDTHPSLFERLQRQGVTPPETEDELKNFVASWNLTRPESCVTKVINKGEREAEIILDIVWEYLNLLPWKVRHEESKILVPMMLKLDQEWKEKGGLGKEKAWKRAALTLDLHGLKKSIAMLEYVIDVDAENPDANFVYGQHLLRHFDDAGIEHVEKAMQNDPLNFRKQGLETLADYYRRKKNDKKYEELLQESFSAADEFELALKERDEKVSPGDRFAEHGLSSEDLSELEEMFSDLDFIKQVFLVRKEVKHVPGSPLYVFLLVTRKTWGKSRKSLRTLLATNLAFARSMQLYFSNELGYSVTRKIHKVPGSRIYRYSRKRNKKKA